MIERKQLRFPSVLFQILDAYCDPKTDPVKFQQLLNYLSVSEDNLRNPDYYFDGDQFYRMLDLLRKNSIYEPASIGVLKRLSATHFGMAGVAGLTAGTLREAINTTMEFYKFFIPGVRFQLENENSWQKLKIELTADFGRCNTILVEIILGSLKQFADEAIGEVLPGKFYFQHPTNWGLCSHETESLYEKYFKGDIEFQSKSSCFVFHREYLNKRLRSHNKIVNDMAREIIGKELRDCNNPTTLTEQANLLLSEALDRGSPVSLELLAGKLHMSSRTLSRKLAKENTNYKVLVNNIRFERAKSLLEQTELPNKQLAAKLGFSNPDGFSRAFKAYTGITPSQWKTTKQ